MTAKMTAPTPISMTSSLRFASLGGVSVLLLLSVGCEESRSEPGVRKASAEDIPAAVDVSGATLTSGFQIGKMRETKQVPGFRITRHPITHSDMAKCIAAGACSSASTACVKAPSSDEPDTPFQCAPIRQAEQYCDWIGGTMASFDQLLLAARGPEVRRFPWGNELADEKQHAAGSSTPGELTEPDLTVGRHKEGASSYGVEDIMITQGELVHSSANALVSACSSRFRGCIVYGLVPGALDSAEPVGVDDRNEQIPVRTQYGFRCVWNEEVGR